MKICDYQYIKNKCQLYEWACRSEGNYVNHVVIDTHLCAEVEETMSTVQIVIVVLFTSTTRGNNVNCVVILVPVPMQKRKT